MVQTLKSSLLVIYHQLSGIRPISWQGLETGLFTSDLPSGGGQTSTVRPPRLRYIYTFGSHRKLIIDDTGGSVRIKFKHKACRRAPLLMSQSPSFRNANGSEM